MSNKHRWIILIVVFIGSSSAFADQILLKEGKTLTGKITKEDDFEYTILLGRNMILRVPKTAVADVKRTVVKEGPRVIRMVPENKPIVASTAAVSSSSGSVQTSQRSDILNIRADVREERREKNGITIHEIVFYKPYTVLGSDFSDIKSFISDIDTGRGILIDKKREASSTVWDPVWEAQAEADEARKKWKKGVVRATITVNIPYWRAPENASLESIQEWNRFISNINSLELGRVQLYSVGLDNFAESLIHLRADSEPALQKESERLFEEMKQKAEKRQQGYIRRLTERPHSPRKR